MQHRSHRSRAACLSAADLAVRLQVGVDTVYRLVREAGLPALRIGGQWRFRAEDVDRWLRERAAMRQFRGATQIAPIEGESAS